MEPVSVSVQLKPEDMRAFSRLVMKEMYRSKGLIALYSAMVLSIVAGLVMSPSQDSAPAGDQPLSVASTLVGLAPLLIFIAVCVRVLRRMRQATGPRYYGEEMFLPRTIRLEQEGMVDRSAQASGTFRWDAFLDLVETPEHVFLRLGIARAHVIPKRCFRSREEMAIFINQFRNRLAAGKASETGG